MKELRVIENDLVPVYETSTGKKVVYGTELHTVLDVKTPYRTWIERRFDECEAIENQDYSSEQICTLSGGTPKKEHLIKLDTAKEMAMLERNEKGKQVRRYFIAIEKKFKERKNANHPACIEDVLIQMYETQCSGGCLKKILLCT